MERAQREALYENNAGIRYKVKEQLVIELSMKDSCSKNKAKILSAIPHEMKKNIRKRGFYAKSEGGIWGIKDSDGVYYDVCETSSIASEMVRAIRNLYSGKKYVRVDIYKRFTRNVYRIYKSQCIYKALPRNKKVYFVILSYEPDKEKRFKEELKAAIKTKARFWSPNPRQVHLIKELK